jgi:molybdopterin-guanine dinucleotide biosynthesis protein
MPEAFVIALLGAESTGKTVLAGALAGALATPARRVAVVAEYLREFCDRHGRTPRPGALATTATRRGPTSRPTSLPSKRGASTLPRRATILSSPTPRP